MVLHAVLARDVHSVRAAGTRRWCRVALLGQGCTPGKYTPHGMCGAVQCIQHHAQSAVLCTRQHSTRTPLPTLAPPHTHTHTHTHRQVLPHITCTSLSKVMHPKGCVFCRCHPIARWCGPFGRQAKAALAVLYVAVLVTCAPA